MALLENVDPLERKVLLFGAPAVVALVLVSRLRGSSSSSEPTPPEAADPAGTIPAGSDGVLGTDQLAEYENRWTEALAGLSQRIGTLENRDTAPPATPPPANPKAPYLQGSALGKRRTTSRNVQPPGRSFPGETFSEISLRVYGERGYWQTLRYLNNAIWPGSPDRAVRAGTVVAY